MKIRYWHFAVVNNFPDWTTYCCINSQKIMVDIVIEDKIQPLHAIEPVGGLTTLKSFVDVEITKHKISDTKQQMILQTRPTNSMDLANCRPIQKFLSHRTQSTISRPDTLRTN